MPNNATEDAMHKAFKKKSQPIPTATKPKPQKASPVIPSPFRVVKQNTSLGGTIQDIMDSRTYQGEVGLEVEVEGNTFPKTKHIYSEDGLDILHYDTRHPLIPERWVYTQDRSLRGNDNAEYIIAQPTTFAEVPEAIDELWDMFEKHGSVLDDSNRTSIHVHMNVQKWHINRVCAFFGLYIIVEDILTHWCGDHRVGNLFCLRAKDAPGIISRLKVFFKTESPHSIVNGMHYSGLNAHAMKKLGSLEVRTMRGVSDPEIIKIWVATLEHIYKLSAEYADDPRDVVHGFSGQSRRDFLNHVVGPHADKIVEECGMTAQQVENSLLEGIRLAQQLCYCRDWSKYKPNKNVRDVFGRKGEKKGLMPQPVAASFDQSGEYGGLLGVDLQELEDGLEAGPIMTIHP